MQYLLTYAIEALSLAGAAYLSIGMILSILHHRDKRTSNPTTDNRPTVVLSDTVVPFKRPIPKLTDVELIKLAKQQRYPGASKWSYKRQLSPQLRASLLKLASQQSA
jgi:hypothetical protein